jgi:hypothetical protein
MDYLYTFKKEIKKRAAGRKTSCPQLGCSILILWHKRSGELLLSIGMAATKPTYLSNYWVGSPMIMK